MESYSKLLLQDVFLNNFNSILNLLLHFIFTPRIKERVVSPVDKLIVEGSNEQMTPFNPKLPFSKTILP